MANESPRMTGKGLRRLGLAIPIATAIVLAGVVSAGAVALYSLAPKGCIADTGDAAGCGASAQGLNGSAGVAVSPDGASVYAVSGGDDAIARFDRAANGALTNAGCIADVGDVAGCGSTAQGLDGAIDVAVSPDGASVYVVSGFPDGAIVRFDRAPSGALLNPSCIANPPDTAGCGSTANGLSSASRVAVSPDGASVYAVSNVAIVRFDRAPSGALTPQGCIADVGDPIACGSTAQGLNGVGGLAVSPDGASVYTASITDDAIVRFDRAPSGALSNSSCIADPPDNAGCGSTAQGLNGGFGVTVSPDGASLYEASITDDAIVRFDRAPSGALSNSSCIADPPNTAGCGSTAQGLANGRSVTVSPDGASAYVASEVDRAIVRFDRAPSGALSNSSCIADVGDAAGCGSTAQGLDIAFGIAVSTDGASVYATSITDSAIVRFSREVPPVCRTSASTGDPGAVQTVALNCFDANDDPLTIQLVTTPTHGTLGAINQAAKTVTYTPAGGYTGADYFDIRAIADGKLSNVSTVVLAVQTATGLQGPQGPAGPAGPPGRDATVTCKPKGKKVKCRVAFASAAGVRKARLSRAGVTYAEGKPVASGSALVLRVSGRTLPRGRYTLTVVQNLNGSKVITKSRVVVG